MTIARRAAKLAKVEGLTKENRRRRRTLSSFEENDQIWAVFDRDEHPHYDEAVNLCSSSGVFVGRSNPCFELWLILHQRDYDKPDGRNAVCTQLHELHPNYDPTGSKICVWGSLLDKINNAERRASRQLSVREEEGAPFGRPSTTVGKLTAALREANEVADLPVTVRGAGEPQKA